MQDIAKELSPGSDRVREQMLLWSDVSRAAALAMLEFVYCDTTERATTLLQEDLEQLTQLARRCLFPPHVASISFLIEWKSTFTPILALTAAPISMFWVLQVQGKRAAATFADAYQD